MRDEIGSSNHSLRVNQPQKNPVPEEFSHSLPNETKTAILLPEAYPPTVPNSINSSDMLHHVFTTFLT